MVICFYKIQIINLDLSNSNINELKKFMNITINTISKDSIDVNIITENTFPSYFCNPDPDAKKLGYGFTGDFELLDQRWLHNTWLVGLLRANKISQEYKNNL